MTHDSLVARAAGRIDPDVCLELARNAHVDLERMNDGIPTMLTGPKGTAELARGLGFRVTPHPVRQLHDRSAIARTERMTVTRTLYLKECSMMKCEPETVVFEGVLLK